jgi:hypothetical protein
VDISEPLLSNGAVNTLPLLGSRVLIMQQLDFNNVRDVFSTWSMARGYKRDEVKEPVQKPIFSSEWMLHKDYCRKSLAEKISGRESQGA